MHNGWQPSKSSSNRSKDLLKLLWLLQLWSQRASGVGVCQAAQAPVELVPAYLPDDTTAYHAISGYSFPGQQAKTAGRLQKDSNGVVHCSRCGRQVCNMACRQLCTGMPDVGSPSAVHVCIIKARSKPQRSPFWAALGEECSCVWHCKAHPASVVVETNLCTVSSVNSTYSMHPVRW